MDRIPTLSELTSPEQADAIHELENARFARTQRLKIEREEEIKLRWGGQPVRFGLQAIGTGIVFALAYSFVIEKVILANKTIEDAKTIETKIDIKVSEKNNELLRLQNEIDVKTANKEAQDAKELTEQLKMEVEDLQLLSKNLSANISTFEGNIKTYKEELKNTTDKFLVKDGQLKSAKEELRLVRTKLDSIASSQQKNKVELQNTIVALESRIQKLDLEIGGYKTKIDDLRRYKEQVEAAPSSGKLVLSKTVKLEKRQQIKLWDELELQLLNITNVKQKADLAYKVNSEWLYAYNMEVGYAVARQKGAYMFIIRVDSTQRNPEKAIFSVFRITVQEEGA